MSFKKRFAAGARGHIRAHQRPYAQLLGLIGTVAPAAERRLRQKLKLPRELVELHASPAGKKLRPPLRMETRGGAELIASSLYYVGWRGFEHPFPVLLEALLEPSDGAFVDIGANTGLYTLLAKSLRPSREVFAFEPFPLASSILRANLSKNSDAADVRLIAQAASDVVGKATLYIPSQEHGLVETSASLLEDFRAEHSDSFEIDLVTADQVLGDHKVALIKVDVEGAEGKVLAGLNETLRVQRALVLCEILQETDTWLDVKSSLNGLGYDLAGITESCVVRTEVKLREAENYVIFPQERIGDVERASVSAGLAFR